MYTREYRAHRYLLLCCVLFARYARTACPNSLPTATTCAPPSPIPVPHHVLRSHQSHCHPQMPTLGIHSHPQPTMLGMIWCCSFCHMLSLMSVHCACARVWCVCLCVLGCFPLVQVLNPSLNTYAYDVVPFLTFCSLIG